MFGNVVASAFGCVLPEKALNWCIFFSVFWWFWCTDVKNEKISENINYFDAFLSKKHPAPQYQTPSKLQLLQNRFSENFQDTLWAAEHSIYFEEGKQKQVTRQRNYTRQPKKKRIILIVTLNVAMLSICAYRTKHCHITSEVCQTVKSHPQPSGRGQK